MKTEFHIYIGEHPYLEQTLFFRKALAWDIESDNVYCNEGYVIKGKIVREWDESGVNGIVSPVYITKRDWDEIKDHYKKVDGSYQIGKGRWE